jgi:hypothetical protein
MPQDGQFLSRKALFGSEPNNGRQASKPFVRRTPCSLHEREKIRHAWLFVRLADSLTAKVDLDQAFIKPPST